MTIPLANAARASVAATGRAGEAFLTRPSFTRPMPAKGMCPQCGHKMRGPSHLCDPMKVERETKRNAALAKISK